MLEEFNWSSITQQGRDLDIVIRETMDKIVVTVWFNNLFNNPQQVNIHTQVSKPFR